MYDGSIVNYYAWPINHRFPEKNMQIVSPRIAEVSGLQFIWFTEIALYFSIISKKRSLQNKYVINASIM